MTAATTETSQKLKFNFSPSQHTVQILLHLVTTFLDLSNMHYVDTNL
jgi:hypothetical protein